MQDYACSESLASDDLVSAPETVPVYTHRTDPTTRRYTPGVWVAAGAVFVIAILALTAGPFPLATGGSSQSPGGPVTPLTTSAYGNCNPVGTKTPSALLQGIAPPPKNVTPGGNLSAVMEVEALNWTPALSNITVIFPSVYFDFPKATGGNEQLFFTNRSIVMNFSGWSQPSFASTRNYVFPNGLQFKAHSKATIDSMKLAVQATAGYGQITIEVRWQWIYNPHLGTTVHGAWSIPTNQSDWPTAVPSIFWPAPYATYLNSSGPTATIGDNFTATLGGDVGGRTFFLEMEYPSGSVVQDFLQTAPPNATTFTVRIPMLNYDHYLTPGPFLVHIHDACGAMMFNKTVDAVFPPSASVSFFLTPSACASKSITFNGTKFTNDTGATFAPSTTAYHFSIPACTGHSFHTWSTTGALHIANGSSMLVSNNGSFTVDYN
jgi:hypothetical protein